MGLKITHLALTKFRNYGDFELDLGCDITVLVGPNAAGKTNVVEALQLLTAATSFRNPAWSDVVMWGEAEARAELHAEDGARQLDIRLDISGNRRAYRVNGQPRRKTADVKGVLPSVLFTPDDLRMIKDSAEKRRRAIDEAGEQLSPAYAAVGSEFERALKQRNAILRDENAPRDILEAWTERVTELGASYTAHRVRLFNRIAPRVAEVYAAISEGEELALSYLPSWSDSAVQGEPSKDEIGGCVRVALDERAAEEQARGTTVVGPHRDDIVVSIGGRDARAFASQGQQRSAALAWKLAEVQVIEDVSGAAPVLLLDDVMSELDEARRRSLARFVKGRVQTVMTTTNLGYFGDDLVNSAAVVEIGG